jgi:hypothetical protein
MGDIANLWQSSSESGDLSVDEGMPVVTALAHEDARVPESFTSVEDEDPDPLSLANLWNGEEEEVDADDVDELDEDSVDELTTPRYACEVLATISEPALPDVFQVAEGCAEEELPEEWSYGPAHFDFLNDEMFASDNEDLDLEKGS